MRLFNVLQALSRSQLVLQLKATVKGQINIPHLRLIDGVLGFPGL